MDSVEPSPDSLTQSSPTPDDSESPRLDFLAPYRNEIRDVVKPLADGIRSDVNRHPGERFRAVLGELERLVNAGEWPVNPREEYIDLVNRCRNEPESVTDRELAQAFGLLTRETRTDMLGAMYQLLGQTAEEFFQQYFTPPNVADAVSRTGEITRGRFTPPTPSVENVSGQAGLDMFSSPPAASSVTDSENPSDTSTVVFDPTCGSGRLLLAANRHSDNVVSLGWELETTAAQMAGLTLALVGCPGWVVGGDALALEARTVYRIAPDTNQPLQGFRNVSGSQGTTLPQSAAEMTVDDGGEAGESPLELLETPCAGEDACLEELAGLLRRGVDQVVGNPPFDTESLASDDFVAGFDTVRKTPRDPKSTLRGSQKQEWLFLELALRVTRSSGAVTMVVPKSMLSAPSEKKERQWLLDVAYYEAAVSLLPATFAPETTAGTSIVSFVPRAHDEVGLNLDYPIFMAVADSVGIETDGTVKQFVHDGEPVTVDVEALPACYTAHHWLGRDQVKLPDDDLYAVSREHTQMREENSAYSSR